MVWLTGRLSKKRIIVPNASVSQRQNHRLRHAANDAELRDTFHRWVEQPPYLTSLISAVQSAAELTALYPANVELRAAVVQVWDRLTEGTLIGRAIWNLRTRRLLGIVG